jgi:hypothetical protein
MMIDRHSRYRTSATLTDKGRSGEPVELIDLRAIPKTTGDFRLTPTDSDRLDHLAWRFYRDPTKFWRICDASDYLDPLDVLYPGEPVIIPPDV